MCLWSCPEERVQGKIDFFLPDYTSPPVYLYFHLSTSLLFAQPSLSPSLGLGTTRTALNGLSTFCY